MNDLFNATTTMLVHPAANCFRLMREDELADLIEDIKANGLRDPITIGRIAKSDLMNADNIEALVDGRNRLRACELGGFEPRFETWEFNDDEQVRAFVRSRSARRDLTKGERAAAEALLDLNPTVGKHRDRSSAEIADEAKVSTRRIEQARQVGRYSIELLEAVRDGNTKLDDANHAAQSMARVASGGVG